MDATSDHRAESHKRLQIGFLNWAHAIDHFVLGIYPTVVIGLEVVYRRRAGRWRCPWRSGGLFRGLL